MFHIQIILEKMRSYKVVPLKKKACISHMHIKAVINYPLQGPNFFHGDSSELLFGFCLVSFLLVFCGFFFNTGTLPQICCSLN